MVDKLIDTKNSLAIRSNWVVAAVDIIWLQCNTLMARSLVLPIESFHFTIFPLVYATKIVASDAVDTLMARSPRLLLHLLLLHSSSHGEPPTRLQAISHDPLFGRSKPSNREASGPLEIAHHRPRSPPVLAVDFLTDGAAPHSSSSATPSSTMRPLVASSSSLSLSPPSDLSSSPAPSLTGSTPDSRPPSPSSTFAPPPSPVSPPSSLFTTATSFGFSLIILNLASPTSTSPTMPSVDSSFAGRRCPDVVPHCYLPRI